MKLVKIRVNANEFEFVCNSRGTRHGFAHDVTLFVEGRETASTSVHYLNRTWESWSYQTACLACLNNALDDDVRWLTNKYKYDNNLSRIVGEKRKAEVRDIIDNDFQVITLRAVKRELQTKSF